VAAAGRFDRRGSALKRQDKQVVALVPSAAFSKNAKSVTRGEFSLAAIL
jgi:hypothetical protein